MMIPFVDFSSVLGGEEPLRPIRTSLLWWWCQDAPTPNRAIKIRRSRGNETHFFRVSPRRAEDLSLVTSTPTGTGSLVRL